MPDVMNLIERFHTLCVFKFGARSSAALSGFKPLCADCRRSGSAAPWERR